MPPSSNGKPKRRRSTTKNSGSAPLLDQRFVNLDQRFFVSPVTGQPVRVEQATDDEFDQFIRQYVVVRWTLEDRLQSLVEAIQDGHEVALIEA